MVIVVRKKKLLLSIGICFMLGLLYRLQNQPVVSTFALPTAYRIIMVDPGHGGIDPGRVGEQGLDEKDLNLQIALYLKTYLEQSGAYVRMTRTDDKGLYDESDTNKKRADLKKRTEKINQSEADIAISIHQNSFPQKKYKGAQVFYYEDSKEGKRLAEILQEELRSFLDPENHRQVKANDTYYLLKQTKIPMVIVECGFISNPEEERKLNDTLYQEKVAWGIYVGIMKYFNELDRGLVTGEPLLN
ncbi:MAG: N-acetylmuramoyl-L-alanine amidase CwlD [Epulopiscium sp.]|nr:N-acetylmuramoyl-L-alanine amidase CwlD [Candidatus Epulonipiscium sp.]